MSNNTIDLPINFKYGDIISETKSIEEPKIFDYQKGLLVKIAVNCGIAVGLLKQPIPPGPSLSAFYIERMKTASRIAARAGHRLKEELFRYHLRKRRPDLYAMVYGFQAQNRKLRGRESIKINRRRVRLLRSIKNV